MCWEERTLHLPWIKKYFTKEKDFRVRCREQSCKTTSKYTSVSREFKKHMLDTHPDVYEHEENKKKNKDWKYFSLTKERNMKCVLCPSEFSSDDSLSEHVKSHLKREKNSRYYQNEDWSWKYLKQFGDFSAKCKLCVIETESVYKLHLHIANIKKHIAQKHKVHQLELSAKYSYWKYRTEKHYFLNKCYRKPVNFQTECRFCKQTFLYVMAESFHHITKHTFICKIEESTEMPVTYKNWQYFRFTKQEVKEEIECIICKETLRNEECQMEEHIEKHSEENNLIPYQFSNWIFKYAKEEEDTVKCTICEESINVGIRKYHLKLHISGQHEEDYKRIKEEEILWKCQTERNNWLQKCYTDAGDFRAKCKFCECKEVYIKNKQFEVHVKEAHFCIHFLETNCKPFDPYYDQWKCIRYIDNMNEMERETECMICQKTVSDPHLNHCSQELKSYSHHWALKYAKQDGNRAKCTTCNKDVDFECDINNLIDHVSSVHREEWKRIQKDSEQETAGPSTSHAS